MGKKHWANTWTEIEDLGGGKFGATISVGHRVFKDKTDGQYKKHKLTDERPVKDYVLVQSAKCCVEVHPYYARYFDIDHEEIRLHEERWVVQRLFKEPDKWKEVDAYNPVINIEEYSEPAGDVVKVIITYDTDYGELVVEYFQRDGNSLKHNISFKNISGGTETFRVLQRWAGIVGTKCNGKDIPVIEDVPYLAFHDSDKPKKKFNIAVNLYSMLFNEDGSEKTDRCLQRPINIETHAQGMKADFIYGNWILSQGESLEIDPDIATLDDPTEDGDVISPTYVRVTHLPNIRFYWTTFDQIYRGYVEWDIESIPDSATITKVEFRYEGQYNPATDNCWIYAMANQPSEQPDDDAGNQVIHNDIADGTAYLSNNAIFPEVGTGKDVGGASGPAWDNNPNTDLQNALINDWFAFGFKNSEVTQYDITSIYSEKNDGVNPPPTLYVEYSVAADFEYVGMGTFAYSGTATQIYTRDYLTTASGQLNYSGSARQVYSKNYLFEGSGELAFSGNAIIIFGLAFVGSGSLAYSGEAVVTYTRDYISTAVGELIYSGEAIFSYLCNFLFIGSGELAYSGVAEQSYTRNFSYVADGSFTISGEGTYALGFAYTGSGSLIYSGEAIQIYTFNYLYVGSGELVYSGSAVQIHTRYYLYEGSGDFTYSGDAITTIGFVCIGSGELIYSGIADCSYQVGADFEYIGSGEFVFSGIALQSYTKIFSYLGSGEFACSGTATQVYTKNFLYSASGQLLYSGTAFCSLGFCYVGDGTFVYSGTAIQTQSRNYLYIGSGEFIYSGSAICIYEIEAVVYEYIGSGQFIFGGTAFRFREIITFLSRITKEIILNSKIIKEIFLNSIITKGIALNSNITKEAILNSYITKEIMLNSKIHLEENQ